MKTLGKVSIIILLFIHLGNICANPTTPPSEVINTNATPAPPQGETSSRLNCKKLLLAAFIATGWLNFGIQESAKKQNAIQAFVEPALDEKGIPKNGLDISFYGSLRAPQHYRYRFFVYAGGAYKYNYGTSKVEVIHFPYKNESVLFQAYTNSGLTFFTTDGYSLYAHTLNQNYFDYPWAPEFFSQLVDGAPKHYLFSERGIFQYWPSQKNLMYVQTSGRSPQHLNEAPTFRTSEFCDALVVESVSPVEGTEDWKPDYWLKVSLKGSAPQIIKFSELLKDFRTSDSNIEIFNLLKKNLEKNN